MRRYDKAARGQRLVFNGIGAAVKIANRVYKEQQRENRRRERAVQSYIAKCEREEASAQRRRIREAERNAREQARIARESEKLQKKLQFDAEVQSIIEENEHWISIHKDVTTVISDKDLLQAINDAEFEKEEVMYEGLFEVAMPQKISYKQQATKEAATKFDILTLQSNLQSQKDELSQLQFNEPEPTEDIIKLELDKEAKSNIKAFWPWKKKSLIKEYIQERFTNRLADKHEQWLKAKAEYDSKVLSLNKKIDKLDSDLQNEISKRTSFIDSRTEQLYNQDFTSWKLKRDKFYDDYLTNLHGLLNGDPSVIEDAFDDALSDNDLPMEYYVESMYDEPSGVVRLDVDLPEIEDIPKQKIVLTSTGKQSIRSKAQKDLNEDYVQCICGLAIFLAENIFNISPKIKNVEISGFTQRQDPKTNLVTDQYVYIINFDRETFNKILFANFTALQIFSFFHHHIHATKTMVLKEIDLATSYDEMKHYVPVDYDDFLIQNPDYAKKRVQEAKNIANSSSGNSLNQSQMSSASVYAKAAALRDQFYTFVTKLNSPAIEKHANSLRDVHIHLTAGPFKEADFDVSRYRGKIFFCCIADLYHSLKQMGVDVNSTKDSVYVYALFLSKIFIHTNLESSFMPQIFDATKAFNNGFPMDSLPAVPHKFMILELMCDYKDLSYYRQYHNLLKELAEFVQETSQNNTAIKNAVHRYLLQLNEYKL